MGHRHKKVLALLLSLGGGFGLWGCGSAPSLTGLASTSGGASAETGKPFHLEQVKYISTLALGQLLGPGDAARSKLARYLDKAAHRSQIALLNYPGADADYRLDGTFSAAQYKNKLETAYGWAVTDRTGSRVGYAAGVETVTVELAEGQDAWNAVPDRALEAIAERGITAIIDRH